MGVGSAMPGWLAAGCAAKKGVFYDREITTVCKADADLPRHSEGSIIELNDSTLLLSWQRSEASEHGSGDEAPSTIALLNSSDGGRTWGNFRIAVERDENTVNIFGPNFLRLQNGEILLFYYKYNQHTARMPRITTGYMIRSRDEGKTFGQPEMVWQQDRFTTANSSIRRLSSGRVILPMSYTEGEWLAPTEKIHVRVIYSDDDCRTWVFGQHKITLPMRGAMEPFIAELNDGRLMMVMRNQLGSVFKSYSVDGGESWSLPQTTGLKAPESCPYVTNIPGSDKIMVVWNNAEYNMHWRSHYGKRTPLTAAISADGGVTFTDFWDIETDPKTAFTNPGITWTSDGVCLLSYWACTYTEDWRFFGLIDLKLARFRVRV